MPKQFLTSAESQWPVASNDIPLTGEEVACPRTLNRGVVKLTLFSTVALVLLGGLFCISESGDAKISPASGLCQPCDATRACGVMVQDVVSPSDSLSALVFGSVRTAHLPLECKAGSCVPTFLPQPESLCQPVEPFAPEEIEAFEGRSESDNAFATRKLHMERHSMRSLKKRRRRLQRIRNDKFTEYFQSRAVGVGGEGGHGYLGINLHGSDD